MRHEPASHVEGLILAELDNDLGALDRKTMESHVRQCAECAGFRMDQRALQRAVAGPPLSPIELESGHDLVWRRLSEARVARGRALWRTAWNSLALIAMGAFIAGVTLTFGLTRGAAEPDSTTAVVARQEISLSQAVGTITVVERLGADRIRQVVVMTDLRLEPAPTGGVLEIRTQKVGEGYGILATVPTLTGVSHANIEGAFSLLQAGTNSAHYDVWVLIEADGVTYQSSPIPLRISSDRAGLHARLDQGGP